MNYLIHSIPRSDAPRIFFVWASTKIFMNPSVSTFLPRTADFAYRTLSNQSFAS